MIFKTTIAACIITLLINSIVHADTYNSGARNLIDQSKINWLLDREYLQKPRGGTSRGMETEVDLQESQYFKKLLAEKNKKQKDRLAILSMTGEYRANFEFTEMFGSDSNYELDNPYKSWGTEKVLIIENQEDFISLQHIIVMYFKNSDGSIMKPHVMKHWRQDWKYEDKKILTYRADEKWENIGINNSQGTWSQTVYQVDDTPRYESYGEWIHGAGASKWISKITPRPLPRREFSIRSDYDLLSGINKISIMSWGWVMEEINDKLKKPSNFIGSEYGIARYQRIKNYDFNPALTYWKNTYEYWSAVRSQWMNIINDNKIVCMNKLVEGKPSYMYYFMQAEKFKSSNNPSLIAENISSTTESFLKKRCEL